MASVNQLLKDRQKEWSEAKAITSDFDIDVPDGPYNAKVLKATVGQSRQGRLQTEYSFLVVGGPYDGKKIPRYQGLDRDESFGYEKAFIKRAGGRIPKNITKLPDVLAELVDTGVRIQVATSTSDPRYRNIYMNGTVDLDDIDEEEDDGAERKTRKRNLKGKVKEEEEDEEDDEDEEDEDDEDFDEDDEEDE